MTKLLEEKELAEIRKRDAKSAVYEYEDGSIRARSPSDKETLIADRRRLLLAYDALLAEIGAERAISNKLRIELSNAADQPDIQEAVLRKLNAFTSDQRLRLAIDERDAIQREKAAAMGLVEGHALTIAKLEQRLAALQALVNRRELERDEAIDSAVKYRAALSSQEQKCET